MKKKLIKKIVYLLLIFTFLIVITDYFSNRWYKSMANQKLNSGIKIYSWTDKKGIVHYSNVHFDKNDYVRILNGYKNVDLPFYVQLNKSIQEFMLNFKQKINVVDNQIQHKTTDAIKATVDASHKLKKKVKQVVSETGKLTYIKQKSLDYEKFEENESEK